MSPESGLPGEVECFRFCCAMRSSSLCSEHPLISLKERRRGLRKEKIGGGLEEKKNRIEEQVDRRAVARNEYNDGEVERLERVEKSEIKVKKRRRGKRREDIL